MTCCWWYLGTLDRNNPWSEKPRGGTKAACVALALGVAMLIGGSPAVASQIPPGCSTGDINLGLQKSTSSINNGDTVTYTVTLENGGPPSCTASNLVIRGFCPDATGDPNTVPQVTFPTIANLSVPTAAFTVGTFSCVVTVNAGVTTASARNSLTGILNDLEGVDDPLVRANQVSVTVAEAPPPVPTSVPTLSEWVMIMLGVFLALAAGAALRRKRIS